MPCAFIYLQQLNNNNVFHTQIIDTADTADTDEDYFLPLQDQRVFGAGIKRKRIAFVPASSNETSVSTPKSTSVGSRYLSIVLPTASATEVDSQRISRPPIKTCAVCKQPISSADSTSTVTSHESSIAHQVCLEHSHPPSHLDREHVGLKYLSTYGWDPDSRRGLGARSEGIRIPIKPKEKRDTAGLREREEDGQTVRKKTIKTKKEEKVVRLNAKEVRLKEQEAKHRAEQLRRSLYGPDLEKYLGPMS